MLCCADHGRARPPAEPIAAILGIHEGARRAIQCADGGHVVGFKAWILSAPGVIDPFIHGLSVKCSSWVLGLTLALRPVNRS